MNIFLPSNKENTTHLRRACWLCFGGCELIRSMLLYHMPDRRCFRTDFVACICHLASQVPEHKALCAVCLTDVIYLAVELSAADLQPIVHLTCGCLIPLILLQAKLFVDHRFPQLPGII